MKSSEMVGKTALIAVRTYDSSFVCQQIVRFTFGKSSNPMNDEAVYCCSSCGEEIVVPIDLSAGSVQQYVEDCPVCCHPNVIHVEVDEAGDVNVWTTEE